MNATNPTTPAVALREAGCLLALLDSAKDQRVAQFAIEHEGIAECLYQGEAAQSLRFAAPYVFDFRGRIELFDTFTDLFWGQNCGIWFSTAASVAAAREDFRRQHRVTLPDGRDAYFRFFDPRVFKPFVESLPSSEAGAFWEIVARFAVETERGTRLTFYQLEGDVVTVTSKAIS